MERPGKEKKSDEESLREESRKQRKKNDKGRECGVKRRERLKKWGGKEWEKQKKQRMEREKEKIKIERILSEENFVCLCVRAAGKVFE